MKCTVKFIPLNKTVDADAGIKLLVVARRNQIPIRFGCGACKCGTCGVLLSGEGKVSEMQADEKKLLDRIGLTTDGQVRLACRTKILSGEVIVDLDFQDTYTPHDFSQDEEG